jgi:hypothetical protein
MPCFCPIDTSLIYYMYICTDKNKHTNYLVIMPVIIAMLFSFSVVRFIGMGTGNNGLYIGDVCLVSAMALKQLRNVRGARKRLGK